MTRGARLSSAIALAAALCGCGGPSRPSSSFATRAEAAAAVPAWVPAAATELRVVSDERSGEYWLRFRLAGSDRPALEAGLLRIPDEQVGTLTFRAPRGVDWWFRGLVQTVPAREKTVIAADVFSGAGRDVPRRAFVAFDRASDAVYAWSAGR